jgi:DnaJ-domain-containing protein 1
MGPIIIGVVVLLIALWAMHGFARIDPKTLAQVLRKSGGIAALAGAVFLTARAQVRSDFVEMELDHDTGAMRGRILKGRMEGVTLDALDVTTLMSLLPEIDDESRALLMAYLDRREPSWREHADAGSTAGPGDVNSGKMTEEEAYQILGVQPGASAADIGRAHRALMKKLHPDQGGSTYLAARVNQAKDLLLKRHR